MPASESDCYAKPASLRMATRLGPEKLRYSCFEQPNSVRNRSSGSNSCACGLELLVSSYSTGATASVSPSPSPLGPEV